MEAVVSEILENVLSLLAMEGSFEVTEGDSDVVVSIDTEDAGRLIGVRGETIDALQLLVNQIASKQHPEAFKRVIVDVGDWRKNKESELASKAQRWADEVKESGKEMELEPMPAWQRRIVHLTIESINGVSTQSIGEGRDRHLVITPGNSSPETQEASAEEAQDLTPLDPESAGSTGADLDSEAHTEEPAPEADAKKA